MKRLINTALTLGVTLSSLSPLSSSADFLEDSSLSGKIRTVYYDVKKSDRVDADNPDHPKQSASYAGAWTSSVALDASSGYWRDLIGVNASFYGVTKIDMPERNGSNSKELLNDNKEGFSKLGQAFIKLKAGDEENNAQLNAGRQLIYNALISSSTSRSVPSTWRGYNFNANIQGIHIGLAYVDQMSLRNQAGFHRLENFDGKHIDYIVGGQLDTTLNNFELRYRNAYSKGFLQAHNIKVGYTFDLGNNRNLSVDTRYYLTKKNGSLWTGYTNWKGPVTDNNYDPATAAFDDKAENITLNAELNIGAWELVGSIGYTSAKSTKTLGHYYYDFGKNTHGIFDSPISAFGEDFLYHNETAWKTGFFYDFSSIGVKALKAGYIFHYGSGMTANNGKAANEHEHNFYMLYTPPQPALKGFKFKLSYALYQNNDSLRDTIGFGKKNDLRTWVDYQFAIF
ncbi:MAG: OprD family outer membrane porin [Endozoicomonas sp. (ex Botrylloides leachii)]|nr:OprD family outer membrane porin [Endozoicomonas sp. (ex Botrylloides leachii)]